MQKRRWDGPRSVVAVAQIAHLRASGMSRRRRRSPGAGIRVTTSGAVTVTFDGGAGANSPENHRRVVLAYHGLSVVITLALVGTFLAVFLFTGYLLLSSLAAAVPSVFLTWRWILAGRQIDGWGIPEMW
jgi:hypothetical protein